MTDYAIVIDGELIEGRKLYTGSNLPNIDEGRRDWYLAENSDGALEAAKEYWRDMAAHDAKELICMVGEERIVELWASGVSLEDWIDENVTPEGEFASYNGEEVEITDMVEYLYGEYPNLADWIDEIAEGVDDYDTLDDPEEETEDDEGNMVETPDFDDKAQIVACLKGWQHVIDECGYTPTVAYRHN